MNFSDIHIDREACRLLQEAAEWRLLGLLFECPSDTWRLHLVELSASIADEQLRSAATAARNEASEGFYHSLFGPGGPVPAREVSAVQSVELGSMMSELAAYYDAFDYSPATREPCDHLSVETGFIGYLRLKEAYASIAGDAESVSVTRDAALRFIKEHLAMLAEPVASALDGRGPDYLVLASQALLKRTGSSNPRRSQPEIAVLDSESLATCAGESEDTAGEEFFPIV